jgi:hypothetical protein
MTFASPPPIIPSQDIQPKLFEGRPPDDMIESTGEQRVMPPRVQFEPLAHNDDTEQCDIAFLDELCQEIRGLMRTASSYPKVLTGLVIRYHLGKLNGEGVDMPQWRAHCRIRQLGKA